MGGLGLALVARSAATQAPAAAPPAPVPRPFFVGERLAYRVRVGRLGAVGRLTMVVDTPQVVRGTPAWVLRFDFAARVGPIRAVDRTESWLDPARLAALRFHEHERHPLAKHDERVEIDPSPYRWTAEYGAGGAIASDAPPDELSFMYVLRTLPLDADTTVRHDRHLDAALTRTPARSRPR